MKDSFVVYSHQPIGYIDDSDWSSLDPDAILATIREKQETSNTERAEAGYSTLTVLGWQEPPQYVSELDVAYWALLVENNQGKRTINAVALKLARDGFTRVTWVGDPSQFQGAQSTLVTASSAYHFNEGAQYADYTQGDKVAGVGLAGLATGLLTGKGWAQKAGVGVLALILAFFKKAWLLLLLPLAFVKKLLHKKD